MSYPILYSATETSFDHNGIGVLSACVSCEVTEEANGIFELAMTYPMDGIHYAEIADRAIIKAKADQFRDPQLFRVYAVTKPMSGIVTVLAQHISYDLSGIPVQPFSAPTASIAMSMLKQNAIVDCPFNFWTDKETQANFKVSVPASIRSRLCGVAGSILDVYGGEYEFDNFTVKLHKNRGQNRGFSIRYGKNLTDIQQDQNCSNVATGVYPYWIDSDGAVLVELPERIVNAPGKYNFVKVVPLDLSAEFEAAPTVDQLRTRAQSYVNANNIGVPSISLSVSFAQLEQSEEYKGIALLERVSLFDTVNVEFPALGVSATARAVKMVYDVIADRVKSVTLGSVRANIADTVAKQGAQMTETAKAEAIRALNSQTPEEAFNRLTDNGRIQGLYIEGNKWYMNAESVATGKLHSRDFSTYFDLDRGEMVSKDESHTLRIGYGGLDLFNKEGQKVFLLQDLGFGAGLAFFDYEGNLVGSFTGLLGQFIFTAKNLNFLGKFASWKSNGDGTYTLIGRDE